MTANIQQMEGFMKGLIERVPLRKMGDPVDVANTALFLASEEGRYYTGSILHPDGGVVMQ
jgi:3-oxoacyl-[acyl-carrier protein] reductase